MRTGRVTVRKSAGRNEVRSQRVINIWIDDIARTVIYYRIYYYRIINSCSFPMGHIVDG